MAFSIALRVTGDASLAEDVLQDAFLGACATPAAMPRARSVKTWLLRWSTTGGRRGAPSPPDQRLAETEDVTPAALMGPTSGARSRPTSTRAPLCCLDVPPRRSASDRAGLLRRAHPAGDRDQDRRAARDRQGPDAPRPARDASPPARTGAGLMSDGRESTHEEAVHGLPRPPCPKCALEPDEEEAVSASISLCVRCRTRSLLCELYFGGAGAARNPRASPAAGRPGGPHPRGSGRRPCLTWSPWRPSRHCWSPSRRRWHPYRSRSTPGALLSPVPRSLRGGGRDRHRRTRRCRTCSRECQFERAQYSA